MSEGNSKYIFMCLEINHIAKIVEIRLPISCQTEAALVV